MDFAKAYDGAMEGLLSYSEPLDPIELVRWVHITLIQKNFVTTLMSIKNRLQDNADDIDCKRVPQLALKKLSKLEWKG